MKPIAPTIAKADEGDEDYEFGFDVEITKFDTDERTVFGWASITEQDGVPVLDRQGDMIATEEMAKAAYDYVVASCKGGHQHKRTETDEPLQVSDMIESMMFTPEKIAKMGLPADTPVGWWCGFRVSDDEVEGREGRRDPGIQCMGKAGGPQHDVLQRAQHRDGTRGEHRLPDQPEPAVEHVRGVPALRQEPAPRHLRRRYKFPTVNDMTATQAWTGLGKSADGMVIRQGRHIGAEDGRY